MDLAEYLSALERIKNDFNTSKRDKSYLPICTQFYQAFANHLTNKKVPTEGALTSLTSTLQVYAELRTKLESDLSWDQLGHVIFVETARVVLGLDFQRMDDTDPAGPKSVFKQALGQTYMSLQEQPTGEFFLVLQWLVVNGWTHSVLQDMMKGSEIEDDKAQNYLKDGEYPEIFRLRVDMLMENGCDDFALNLATWCTKSPIFKTDVYIRQAQLLLLMKLNRQEEFHNTCLQIWETQCCLSLRILQAILTKGRDEDKRPLLTLTQTFLVHDWMKPDKYCCTEPLLKFWLSLEREKEPKADEFIQSVSKMDQLASCPRQLQILIKALVTQFPGEFLQFDVECMLKAMRMDRNKLDTARIYVKDDVETDQSADSLSKSCLIIALMFKQMHQIQLASNMTSFYLDPTEEMYHAIKKSVLDNPPPVKRVPHPSSSSSSDEWDEEEEFETIPIIPPDDVDRHTFFELLNAVDTLRPSTFDIHSPWSKLQKHLRASLEETGFSYNHRKDNFITFEEKMLRKQKAIEKAQRKKQRDEAMRMEAMADSRARSDSTELPSVMKKLELLDGEKGLESSQVSLGLNSSLQHGTNKPGEQDQSIVVRHDIPPQTVTVQPVLPTDCPHDLQDSKEAVSMPLLDITLDELQQVLDNSSQPKIPTVNSSSDSHDLPASSNDLMQQQDTSEDLMLNSIKEFLKEGDVEMQGLTSSQAGATTTPATNTATCNNTVSQPSQEQSQPQSQPLSASVEYKPKETLKVSSAEKMPGIDEPLLFKCKFCGKAYDSMRQRRRHQEWLCKFKVNSAAGERDLVNPPRERPRPLKEDSSLLRDDYGNYLCELCNRVCSNIQALRLHQRKSHNVHKGKSSAPSTLGIKECSVKLDRLEDAPVPKFTKRDPSPEKGKGKEGISKLLSKKYSTGFFLSSLGNKDKDKNTKETSAKKDAKTKKKPAQKINFQNQNDYVRISTSDGDSSDTDEYELVSTIDVDLNSGDATVETFLPTDDTIPVLCDLCGDVCPTYQTMKEHQATCILTPKKSTPGQSPKSLSTCKAEPGSVNAVKMTLFDQPNVVENDSKVTLFMSPGPPTSSNATNIVHAIPYDTYVANSFSSQNSSTVVQQSAFLSQPSVTISQQAAAISQQPAVCTQRSTVIPQQLVTPQTALTTQQKPVSTDLLAPVIPFLPNSLSTSSTKSNNSSGDGDIQNKLAKNDKKKDQPKKETAKKEANKKVQPPKPKNPPKPKKKLITLSYRTCLTCNMEFASASICFQHQSGMSHFQGGVGLMTKYKCADCDKIFNSSQEGEIHLKSHDIQEPKPKSSNKSAKKAHGKSQAMDSSSIKTGGQEIFRSLLEYCQFCKKGFLSQASLDNHLLQGCQAQTTFSNMMVVEPTGVVSDGLEAVMSSVASMMQFPNQQIPQPVETLAYAVDSMVQLQPTLTNEIVVMGEPMATRSVLDPLTNTYIAQISDTGPSAVISHISIDSSQIGSMVTSSDGQIPTVSRQEMGTQVDIDDVPLAELENDMKELAPDLMCHESMIDESELQLEADDKYVVEGDVQVDSITYKNVSMLQHKMWQCSVCSMEFALKKDIITHWEESSCRDEAPYIMDAANFQCVYCGEMFSEAKDCRNHQLASCLKTAGMKVQLLKNRHFHCKLCKGRYFEKCHVQRHLTYYHKMKTDEVDDLLKEWFPESFLKNIEEMLKSKKEAKQRSRSPEHRDGSKSPRATEKPHSPRVDQKPQTKDITIKSVDKEKGVPNEVDTAVKKVDSEIEKSQEVQSKSKMTKTSKAGTAEHAIDTPKKVKSKKKKETTSISEPPVVPAGTISGPRTVMSTTAAKPPNATAPTNIVTSTLPVVNTAPLVTATPAVPSTVPSAILAKHSLEILPDPGVFSLPGLSPMGRPPMPSTPDSLRLESGSCGSPVPTCNISWSSSPGSTSAGAPGTPTSGSTALPAPPVPAMTNTKSKHRSSSVESQLSTMSNKEKKSRGRSPVAPAEYHPCPKCGKVIDDRIALQIHLEFVCGKHIVDGTPSKPVAKISAKKSVVKRKRQNSQGSQFSASQDNGDSRSMFSDDGSTSSASKVNTPSHVTVESDIAQLDNSNETVDLGCNVCGDLFSDSLSLERHIMTSHPEMANFIKCTRCDAMCDGQSGLRNHVCTQKEASIASSVELPQDLAMSSKPDHILIKQGGIAQDQLLYFPTVSAVSEATTPVLTNEISARGKTEVSQSLVILPSQQVAAEPVHPEVSTISTLKENELNQPVVILTEMAAQVKLDDALPVTSMSAGKMEAAKQLDIEATPQTLAEVFVDQIQNGKQVLVPACLAVPSTVPVHQPHDWQSLPDVGLPGPTLECKPSISCVPELIEKTVLDAVVDQLLLEDGSIEKNMAPEKIDSLKHETDTRDNEMVMNTDHMSIQGSGPVTVQNHDEGTKVLPDNQLDKPVVHPGTQDTNNLSPAYPNADDVVSISNRILPLKSIGGKESSEMNQLCSAATSRSSEMPSELVQNRRTSTSSICSLVEGIIQNVNAGQKVAETNLLSFVSEGEIGLGTSALVSSLGMDSKIIQEFSDVTLENRKCSPEDGDFAADGCLSVPRVQSPIIEDKGISPTRKSYSVEEPGAVKVVDLEEPMEVEENVSKTMLHVEVKDGMSKVEGASSSVNSSVPTSNPVKPDDLNLNCKSDVSQSPGTEVSTRKVVSQLLSISTMQTDDYLMPMSPSQDEVRLLDVSLLSDDDKTTILQECLEHTETVEMINSTNEAPPRVDECTITDLPKSDNSQDEDVAAETSNKKANDTTEEIVLLLDEEAINVGNNRFANTIETGEFSQQDNLHVEVIKDKSVVAGGDFQQITECVADQQEEEMTQTVRITRRMQQRLEYAAWEKVKECASQREETDEAKEKTSESDRCIDGTTESIRPSKEEIMAEVNRDKSTESIAVSSTDKHLENDTGDVLDQTPETISESLGPNSSHSLDKETASDDKNDKEIKRKIGRPRKLKNRRESTPDSVKSSLSQDESLPSEPTDQIDAVVVEKGKIGRRRTSRSRSSRESSLDVIPDHDDSIPQRRATRMSSRSSSTTSDSIHSISSVGQESIKSTKCSTPSPVEQTDPSCQSSSSDLQGRVSSSHDQMMVCPDVSPEDSKSCGVRKILDDQTGALVAEDVTKLQGLILSGVKVENNTEELSDGFKPTSDIITDTILGVHKKPIKIELNDVKKTEQGFKPKPKPISPIEEPAIDFHSAVAKAVKAWSKPILDKKSIVSKPKVEKVASEKAKSLDVLLCRKKMQTTGYLDKMKKICFQAKEKQELMPTGGKLLVGKSQVKPPLCNTAEKRPSTPVLAEMSNDAEKTSTAEAIQQKIIQAEPRKITPGKPAPEKCSTPTIDIKRNIRQPEQNTLVPVKLPSSSAIEKPPRELKQSPSGNTQAMKQLSMPQESGPKMNSLKVANKKDEKMMEPPEQLGHSFSVKWKTFGAVPEEVNIDIPFDVNGSPLKHRKDLAPEKHKLPRGAETVQLNEDTKRKYSKVEPNKKASMAKGSVTDIAPGTVKSAANNEMVAGKRACRAASCENTADFNEYHKELHKLVDNGAVDVLGAGDTPTAVMDFMQYHKELHDIVKEEGLEMSLSDVIDPPVINQSEESDQTPKISEVFVANTELLDDTGCLHDGQFVCPFCDDERSFSMESRLAVHLKSFHGVTKDESEETFDLSCPICKGLPAFSEHLMLLYHMRAVHRIANFDIRKKAGRSPSPAVSIKSPCGSPRQSKTSPKVAAHRESKTCSPNSEADTFSDVESTCSDISNITGITGIDSGISLQHDFVGKHPQLTAKVVNTRRVCSYCNIAFMKMEHYKTHVLRYHTYQPKSLQWKCGICQKPFGQKSEWRRHLKAHFPSRSDSGLGKFRVLTDQEKEILREVTRKECGKETQVMYIKSPHVEYQTKQVAKMPAPANRWDQVFGQEPVADKPEKVVKTYTRTASEGTRKIIIVHSVKNQCNNPSFTQGLSMSKNTTVATVIPVTNLGEHPNAKIAKKQPQKPLVYQGKITVNKKLMKPLCVSIPGDDEREKDAPSVQSASSTGSSCQSSHVSSSSQCQSRNCVSSRSTGNQSPNSTVSSSSGQGRISPLSTTSNPEHSLRSPRPITKRRCSCDSGEAKRSCLNVIKETKRASIKNLLEKDRSKWQLRSKDSPDKEKNKSHVKNLGNDEILLKKDVGDRISSSAVDKTGSPNTRSSTRGKAGGTGQTTSTEKCWKLPWEHFLRNTLKKQASSARKFSQTKLDRGKRTKVPDVKSKDSPSLSPVKYKWNKLSPGSLAIAKAKLRKVSQRSSLPPSRRNSSDSQSSSLTAGSRRRRSSISSVHSDITGGHKRRRTETDLNTSRRQLADSFSPTRRISTRLNIAEEVKGMALHTRRAQHVAAIKQQQLRKAVAKSKK